MYIHKVSHMGTKFVQLNRFFILVTLNLLGKEKGEELYLTKNL